MCPRPYYITLGIPTVDIPEVALGISGYPIRWMISSITSEDLWPLHRAQRNSKLHPTVESNAHIFTLHLTVLYLLVAHYKCLGVFELLTSIIFLHHCRFHSLTATCNHPSFFNLSWPFCLTLTCVIPHNSLILHRDREFGPSHHFQYTCRSSTLYPLTILATLSSPLPGTPPSFSTKRLTIYAFLSPCTLLRSYLTLGIPLDHLTPTPSYSLVESQLSLTITTYYCHRYSIIAPSTQRKENLESFISHPIFFYSPYRTILPPTRMGKLITFLFDPSQLILGYTTSKWAYLPNQTWASIRRIWLAKKLFNIFVTFILMLIYW